MHEHHHPSTAMTYDPDNWIDANMPPWLKQALYGSKPWSIGWGKKQDSVYQREQRRQEACNQQLVSKPFTHEGYVSTELEEVDCNGFSGANVIITNKKNGEFRALMVIQRMVNKNGGHKLILSCTGGQRNSIEEDAWTCACREALEETGGFAWFATTPPAHVAWLGQSKKSPASKNRSVHQYCPRRAVFLYETLDDTLAERIQNLRRPPESEQDLLPPFGAPLTAVWVPLARLRDKKFRGHYLPQWADDDRIWTDLATLHFDLTTMHIDLEPLEDDDTSVFSSKDTEPCSEGETRMRHVAKWGVEQVLRLFEECNFPTEGVEAGQVDGNTLLALSRESDAARSCLSVDSERKWLD